MATLKLEVIVGSESVVFGTDARRFIAMIDQLALAPRKTRYSFMDNDSFKDVIRSDPGRGMRVYWEEILLRSHLTAVTAVLRTRHWVAASDAAAGSGNCFALAAALRGLIESAADASTALMGVPATLARDHTIIKQALAGRLRKTMIVDPELEDALIHFACGRHVSGAEAKLAPRTHSALKAREYIEILEKGCVSRVVECYRELCEITHPSAPSVMLWLKPIDELNFELASDRDSFVISELLVRYKKTFLELLMFGFNPALVTLWVLNHFPTPRLHVPELLGWDMSGIRLWQNCADLLKGI